MAIDTRPLVWPSIALLLVWMIVPLALTLYFSFRNYSLVDPTLTGWAGLGNYTYLLTDDSFITSIINTVLLVGGVLIATVVFGTAFAVLFDQEFFGQGVARLVRDRPVLRHAHGRGPGVEEPPDGSGQRAVRLLRPFDRPRTHHLVHQRARCFPSESSWRGSGCPSRP